MRVLLVHPSGLMYSEVYLRLEPLGFECVAEAVRQAGHAVELLDLQLFTHADLFAAIERFKPDAIGFSLNYLANIPEVLELAEQIKQKEPRIFVFAGGHSVSFVAEEVLSHGAGNLDCIVMGEGETTIPAMLEKVPNVTGRAGIATSEGIRPSPNHNFAALDVARRLGIDVAINLNADPSWSREDYCPCPGVGDQSAGDCPPHGRHALSRHGVIPHGIARAHDTRLRLFDV